MRIEPRWIGLFEEVLALSGARAGEVAAVLCERSSRDVLVELAELALEGMGLTTYRVTVPTPAPPPGAPLRSTGTSRAIAGVRQVIDALSGADLIVDVTVEGLLHAAERSALLSRGARIFMIGNEAPEVFERLRPAPGLHELCVHGAELISQAGRMHVTSSSGTNLTVDLSKAVGRGSAGTAQTPASFGYWPAGLCLTSPPPGSVNGRIVFAPGDANLTFKRYFEAFAALTLEADHVVAIEGDNLDAELMRSYLAGFGREAYAVSHVGWGMNPAARWDALVMYDKADVNGIELRAFAGNFLFSTGANETANRFTDGHFDLPMRNCTVQLDDDEPVVSAGVLRSDLRLAA
ncbi:MAG: peptidase M29 [Sphingomonadaceae bacterium]|nr:peptidase M29 [Sphingomonadaceae bacterium]